MHISVVIPTYNGAKRLPLVLDKLKGQRGSEDISWEVIVVDNNSSDNTREVFERCREEWPEHIPLRYSLEERQGAAYARKRGVAEARGEIVAFMDDDCIPEDKWLHEVRQFGLKHPDAGAWGSRVLPGPGLSLPPYVKELQRHLALEDYGESPMLYMPDKLLLPPTAALAVRRKAWIGNVPEAQLLRGRSEGFPVQGDDYEPILYIHKAGWEVWYDPDMVVMHDIDPARLSREHMRHICFANGLPNYALRMIITPLALKPIVFLRHEVRSIFRIAELLVQNKDKDVVRLQLHFFIGVLLSPYFYLILLFRRWFSRSR